MERVNGFTEVLAEILSEARKFQIPLPKGTANKEYKLRLPRAISNFSSVHMNLNQCHSAFEILTELHLSYKINQLKKVEATL